MRMYSINLRVIIDSVVRLESQTLLVQFAVLTFCVYHHQKNKKWAWRPSFVAGNTTEAVLSKIKTTTLTSSVLIQCKFYFA